MPKSKAPKKVISQRTFRMRAHLAQAFDAVCEAFGEDADRVASKFFEDAIRSIARDYRLDHVEQILGDSIRSPFAFDAVPVHRSQESTSSFAGPPGFSYQPPALTVSATPITYDASDMVLPTGVGSRIPAQVDNE